MPSEYLFPEYILSSPIEHKYRQDHLSLDCQQNRWLVLFCLIISALGAGLELQLLLNSPSGQTYRLLMWLIYFGCGGTILYALGQPRRQRDMDILVCLWWLLFISLVIHVSPAERMHPGTEYLLYATIIGVIFLLSPNRLLLQIIPSLVLTLTVAYELLTSPEAGLLPTMSGICLLVLANILAYIVSWRLHRLKRCLFCSGQREEKLRAQIDKLNHSDNLTGLLNRRTFLDSSETEVSRFQRYQRPFSLIMLQVDDLKQHNEEYGHQAGDEMLIALARIMTEQTRDQDLLGRLSGHEFAVGLPETTINNARLLGQRIKEEVAELPLVWDDHQIQIRVAIAVCEMEEQDQHFADLLERCDRLLCQP